MYNTNTDIWIAGAVAAFTVDVIVYPLDTLKTRIQSPNYKKLYTTPVRNISNGTRQYGREPVKVNRAVLFRGLYQGVWSVVIATIPSSGAFFTTYEGVKHILHSASSSSSSNDKPTNVLPFTHPLPTPVIHAIASSTAESVSCFILTPAEVLKQNAQVVNAGSSQNTGSPTRQVLRQFRKHPTRLWSGYTALLARNLPFTGLQFPLFEYLRAKITAFRSSRRTTEQRAKSDTAGGSILERAGVTALSAAIAGSIAAFVTTPIDVIKTRIMLAAGESGSAAVPGSTQPKKVLSKKKSLTGLSVGTKIYREEGLRGLFRGGVLRSGWTALGLGLYLGTYESGRMYLEQRRKRNDEGDRVG